MSRPSRRDYHRIERERRFVLERLPDDVDERDFVRLRDRFVAGTRVRLRRVERPDGTELQSKIGQKLDDARIPPDPAHRRLTTIYLEPGEGAAFAGVPGTDAVKRRHLLHERTHVWAIDVWESPVSAAGLVLAEVEADDDETLAAAAPPASWAAREVTHDPAYAAPALAARGRPDAPPNAAPAPATIPLRALDLDEAFAHVSEPWTPVIAADLNGQQVKLARFRGSFDRHRHEHEDECFLVHRGRFRMEFDDRTVELGPGQMLVVPRGVPHRPVADDEGAEVILFEPASTLNTGDARSPRTVRSPERI